MVSCADKLFRRISRDETFGTKKRGISMYGKYGVGNWKRMEAPGTYFGDLRSHRPCRPGQASKASADPGPITPGRRFAETCGCQLAPQLLPGVMGPGFRQDDNRYAFSPAGENR